MEINQTRDEGFRSWMVVCCCRCLYHRCYGYIKVGLAKHMKNIRTWKNSCGFSLLFFSGRESVRYGRVCFIAALAWHSFTFTLRFVGSSTMFLTTRCSWRIFPSSFLSIRDLQLQSFVYLNLTIFDPSTSQRRQFTHCTARRRFGQWYRCFAGVAAHVCACIELCTVGLDYRDWQSL